MNDKIISNCDPILNITTDQKSQAYDKLKSDTMKLEQLLNIQNKQLSEGKKR